MNQGLSGKVGTGFSVGQADSKKATVARVPALRFPEFEMETLEGAKFDDMFEFSSGKNIKQDEASPDFSIPCVRYGELYHMYSEVITEVVNRTNLDKSELQFSFGDEILLPSAGEDPWDIGSASALTIPQVAIGRTVNILRPKKVGVYSQVFASYYINTVLRTSIFRLARGSSISNVYNSDLKKLSIMLPSLPEQKKIAAFLGAVDAKIAALRARRAGLERYKRGLMQALFSQRLRFTKPDGTAFPDWEKRKLSYYLTEPKARNRDLEFSKNDVLSVSGDVGCVNQIEHMGRSYAGVSVKDYHVVRTGDVVYTKSPLKLNPYGIIKTNFGRDGIVSTLYAVYRPTVEADPLFIHYYFDLDDNLNRYLRPIVRKGAKNDMKVNNGDVIGDPILFPSLAEQQKIADALQTLDAKIAAVGGQADKMEAFKKGLLQQMFV